MNESLETFGARFEVTTNFNQAIREMQIVDRQLDKMEATVRWLGTQGVQHINAFAAAMARAHGGLLNSMGGILPTANLGIVNAGGGQFLPRIGQAPMMALPAWPPPQREPINLGPVWTGAAMPRISQWGEVSFPHAQYGGRFIAGPQGTSMGGGFIPPRFIAGPLGTSPVPEIVRWDQGRSIVPWQPGPPGPPAIIPHPAFFGAGGPYSGFQAAPPMRPWSLGMQFNRGVLWTQRNLTGPAAQAMAGMGSAARMFSPWNLMRLASGLYIGQQVGNFGRYLSNQTIGQAMFLEERQELLENALISQQMGIARPLAETLADRLTSSSYFAGMPVTAAEMGLSRPELAEQFRQLAPIIRLTARSQDEFQTGLQTGALARALLVARDPVQGTRGATVALSELYSGGPDRFRSLSLRFELPRNRLREIEQELGGAGVADPGQVAIQMLTEMGFGPEYLTRRAGTMAGQVERSGALASNFRVELFQGSLNEARDNLTSLNDAFEAFLNSDAGDQAIAKLDRIFGAITGFLTNEPTNLLINAVRGNGPMAPDRIARGVSEFMQARDGQWVDAAGRLTDAATSFREAAELITSKQFEQLLRAPGYGSSVLPGTALGTIGGVVGLGMLDRVLTSGAFARASRQVFTEGTRVAGATMAGGLAAGAGALLPIAAIGGAAALVTARRQAGSTAADWRSFAARFPDIAAQFDVPASIGDNRMFLGRLGRWAGRYGEFWTGGQFPDFTSTYERAQLGLQQGGIEAALTQQAAMLSLGLTDAEVRSRLVGNIYEQIAANPDSDFARRYASEGEAFVGQMVGRVMGRVGDRTMLGQTLAGTVIEASAARNVGVVYGGNTLFADPASMIGPEGQSALWSRALALAGDDSTKALGILAEILENTAQTAVNTSALNPESRFAPMRPSGQGDLFTGYMTDPDMRFIRRTGGALPGLASASPSVATQRNVRTRQGAGPGGTQVVTAATIGDLSYDPFLGGIITDTFGADRTTHMHGGLDYVDSDGIITAPAAGTIQYLTTAEDYARFPRYASRGGAATYGNMAVFTDALGVMSTYAHLSDESIERFGGLTTVNQGQQIGFQGVTGNTTGPHVHQELLVPLGGGQHQAVDPLYSMQYYETALPNAERSLRGGADGINISFGGDIVINAANVDEIVEQATQQFAEGLRAEIMQYSVDIVDNAARTRQRQGGSR